jgi:galactokinase
MTGGGFGGCAVALVERALAPAGMEKLAQRYQAATGITPTLFLTHATGGPAVMPPD